jgi:TRAP-type C4-dicarboxylate transport system permease small subunit
MKAGERFWVIFDRTITILMTVSGIIILLDALAVTIDVLMRYAFSKTYVGLFELTEYSLLWMTFMGAAYIMRNNGHVRVDAVTNLLNPRNRAILDGIASIIGMFILLVVTFYSAKLTLHDFQTDFTLAGILRPFKWPIEIIIPIGFFMLFLQLARNASKQFGSLKTMSRGQQNSSNATTGGSPR